MLWDPKSAKKNIRHAITPRSSLNRWYSTGWIHAYMFCTNSRDYSDPALFLQSSIVKFPVPSCPEQHLVRSSPAITHPLQCYILHGVLLHTSVVMCGECCCCLLISSKQAILFWHLASARHFHSENCCTGSLDIFPFSHHTTFSTLEMVVREGPSRSAVSEILKLAIISCQVSLAGQTYIQVMCYWIMQATLGRLQHFIKENAQIKNGVLKESTLSSCLTKYWVTGIWSTTILSSYGSY